MTIQDIQELIKIDETRMVELKKTTGNGTVTITFKRPSVGVSSEETTQNLHRNYTETTQKLHRNFTETLQKLYRNFTETLQKLYRKRIAI